MPSRYSRTTYRAVSVPAGRGTDFPRPQACSTWNPASSRSGAHAPRTSLMRWAPRDPPVTSSVGVSGSRPSSVRALRRSASRSEARARSTTSDRSGIPVCTAPRSGVPGNVTAVLRAQRAPSRFATPGRAFCSCTTTGTPARRAAR